MTAGTQYNFGGKIFIPAGQLSSGYGAILVSFYNSSVFPSCGNPTFINEAESPHITSSGVWAISSGTVQAPSGAVCAIVWLESEKAGSTGQLQVNFDDMFFQPHQSCSSVNIDTSQFNGLIDVTLTATCDALLTIRNNRNYWTNFQISILTSGATATPLGGSNNAYASAGLLPPSGLVGSSTAVQYDVHFTKPGDLITIFVDPSMQTGNGLNLAQKLNMMQLILDAVPLPVPVVSAVQLNVTNYQLVVQAYAQMPHLMNAYTALFSNPLDVSTFLRELGLFCTSSSELSTYADLAVNLAIGEQIAITKVGVLTALTAVGFPARVIWAIIEAFGDIINFSGYRYTAGSVFLTAQ